MADQPEIARKPDRAKKWRARNPAAAWAHACLRSAVRRGLVEKQPCQVCGTIEAVDAHHDDYARPAVVRWLCRRHHKAAHRAQRRAAP